MRDMKRKKMRTLGNSKPIPITACPFCGKEFSSEDRMVIAEKLVEKDANGKYLYPTYLIVCTHCHGDMRLSRYSHYYDDESVPPT